MPRQNTAQLNIRSEFARRRVAEIVSETGMSASEVIEDALRAYIPPVVSKPVPAGMIRKGRLLVLARRGDRTITLDEANDALDAARERDD